MQPSGLHQVLLPSQFSSLPASFFTKLQPTPLPAPYLVAVSDQAAAEFRFSPEQFQEQEFIHAFSGSQHNSHPEPLAAVYSGHQFGVWAGQLGDGRAILLGDAIPKSGVRHEVQLKGAGPTPYSRAGDGRAVLRSSIREFLCSEAMHALGIPTSRALSIMGSDHYVMRETPETSAVVTRLSPSFIRFGSFEHWYYNNRPDELKVLADFVITHYFPQCQQEDNPYQALLACIARRTAALIAQWQAVGFMHGVMNTDNMSILGLTLDYGPFGFMEAYDERHICNHTDQQGRYAYHMQPRIGHWNTHALAQAMLPLIGSIEETQQVLDVYPAEFENHRQNLFRQKLGLRHTNPDNTVLLDRFFDLMQQNHADFTLTFRSLSHIRNESSQEDERLLDLFIDREGLHQWLISYREHLLMEKSQNEERQFLMKTINPKYILRNYLAQIAIKKAQQKDFSEIKKLNMILNNPYHEQPEHDQYAALPPDWAGHLEVSCSS
ncbi:protein adenylyltransferase SelO [Undibacterium oligocarboniphilum]|uniref:Protein nucleotidyltransferase YdiU n=1 Tax=Undibacterium oligocarboniphilum TaxID=666702 RepID=A0A850QBY4_9BURK|nr:YdiU family protein [Undibacterium oligocarboniphilum]MBC3868798.1 YdiU family protein [Undibacterium oligocarboniphilum]NVO76779.1 YdiU family protein [Undibacterium oligocarboniphilum]